MSGTRCLKVDLCVLRVLCGDGFWCDRSVTGEWVRSQRDSPSAEPLVPNLERRTRVPKCDVHCNVRAGMSTSTSLNLIALFKTALVRSGMDPPARAVSGLTPPAKALYVAGAAHAIPRGAVLYVVPSDRDLEQTVADITFFLSALEGLSPEAAERAVLPFPSHEIDPYRGMAPRFGVVSPRGRALFGLSAGTVRVVVASAPALAPRGTGPERLKNASVDLTPGVDIAPSDLGELLIDAG